MLQTLKSYVNGFNVLPAPVKISIYVVILFLAGFLVYFAASNYYDSYKIEKLEKENKAINDKAEAALDRMNKAQQQAALEKIRADNLESTIKLLDSQSQKQDEQISTSRNNTSNVRRDLNNVRGSQPKRADVDDLDRRLKARYGQAGNSGPGR